MKRVVLALLVCALAMSGVARAQSCHPPGSFYRTTAIRSTVQLAPGANADCDLVSTLAPNNSAPAGAFAWYNLPRPAQSMRISFRIDTLQLGDLQQVFDNVLISSLSSPTPHPPIIDNVSILSVSAPTPYPATGGVSSLLRLVVFPTSVQSGPALWVTVACTAGSGYCAKEIENLLADGDLLRFELTIGAGAAGSLQWWINANFSDPPTVTIGNLDNAAPDSPPVASHDTVRADAATS